MTVDEVNAMIPGAKIYRLTPDARYLMLINEDEFTHDQLNAISEGLETFGVKVAVVIVSDVTKALRIFKMDPSSSPGELRPVESRREPLEPGHVPPLRSKEHRAGGGD